VDDHERTSGLTGLALLTILRRRLLVVVLTFVTIVGAVVAVSLLQEDTYSADASLLFRDPQLDQKLFGSTFLEESTDPAREAATNVSLVSLDAVADRTAKAFGGLSGEDVTDKVEVGAEGQSDLVSVTATDSSPTFAAKLANTFAAEYVDFRRRADREKIREAQRLVENQIADLEAEGADEDQLASLRERLEQLTVLGSLQTGNAELVQEAEPPSSPSSPNLVANTAVGAIVGLIVGVGLALLLYSLDRRLREPDEIGEILQRPVLGVIPASQAIPNEGANVEELPPREFEAFRMIRANLRYFGTASEVKSILVTSAEPGAGKTTVAWNLAAAAASAGARVVLVEADLRRPALRDRLGIRPRGGLSQILAGAAGLDDATVPVAIGETGHSEVGRSVDVIFAGATPPNPTDLLESERMEELLKRLEIRYDAVFLDSPPATAVSDAIPLATKTDGVLVVSRVGRTERRALARLATQLENLHARTLGVVVNGLPRRAGGFGYSYGYESDDGMAGPRAGDRSSVAAGARQGSDGAASNRAPAEPAPR
jgi:capsular exopolysaccharide synthesis family protein